jgi:hypothetical protein
MKGIVINGGGSAMNGSADFSGQIQTKTLTFSNRITADLSSDIDAVVTDDLSSDIDAVVVREKMISLTFQQLQNPTPNLFVTNNANLSTDIDVVAVGNSFFSSRFTPVSRCFFKI